jgi:LAS superfamily LD-carboxypeptidase LdcB
MQTPRRRKRNNNTALKALIGLLVVILAVVIGVAACMNGGPETPPATNPTPAPTDPTETVPPTAAPTEPILTGWQEIDGSKYYYNDQGQPVTGLQTVGDRQWLFGENGALCAAGRQEVFGKTYYLNQDLTLHTGWLEEEGTKYYFHADGTMAKGQVEIDGATWFFTSTGAQIYLVNPWHKVPEGYKVTLKDLPDEYASSKKVADFIYDDLMDMIYDCEEAMREMFAGTGKKVPTVWCRSANRTNTDQRILFQRRVDKEKAAAPGISQAEAERRAAMVVAPPGTSEHQLGLAVDLVDKRLNSLEEAQENMEAQIWLMENCWKYGFILRYPKGTTDITGIIYEPWHYRYVGHAVAAEIHEQGITLEEYIANLTVPAAE